jgi:hypothetical protein
VPALIASRPAARAGTHVTTKDLCIWPNLQDFGVDVGAVFPIVALGKPAPMPYVWHPRRETERAMDVRSTGGARKNGGSA